MKRTEFPRIRHRCPYRGSRPQFLSEHCTAVCQLAVQACSAYTLLGKQGRASARAPFGPVDVLWEHVLHEAVATVDALTQTRIRKQRLDKKPATLPPATFLLPRICIE